MGLQWWRSLACSINIRGGARGAINPRMHTTTWNSSATSSRLNSEALAARVVLAHPRAVYHSYTCGLHRSAAAVAAALIGYNDIKVAADTTTMKRRSWSTTSSTSTSDYVGLLLQLIFCCSARLVVTIHDLLLTSILGWHGRSSASLAYP
jgi:hypothetical protein